MATKPPRVKYSLKLKSFEYKYPALQSFHQFLLYPTLHIIHSLPNQTTLAILHCIENF